MFFSCESSELQRNQEARSRAAPPRHEAARHAFRFGGTASGFAGGGRGKVADHQLATGRRGDGKMGLTCGRALHSPAIL